MSQTDRINGQQIDMVMFSDMFYFNMGYNTAVDTLERTMVASAILNQTYICENQIY